MVGALNKLLLCSVVLICTPYDSLDIDECAEGTDRCAQNCHNTIGSYTCSCNAGYRLNANGYDCDGTTNIIEVSSISEFVLTT